MKKPSRIIHWATGNSPREKAFNASRKPCGQLQETLPAAATPTSWGGRLWDRHGTGPRVLLVIDQPGWAFDNISRRIVGAFGDRYAFSSLYLCGSPSPEAFQQTLEAQHPDMVVFFWYGQFMRYRSILPTELAVACLFFDNASLTTFEQTPDRSGISVVAGSNRRFVERLQATGLPAFPCVDGVDTQKFVPLRPLSRAGKLRVMWTGFSAHGGADLKGFWSIIDPLRKSMPEIEWLIRDRADGYFPHETMPDWYNTGDVVLCASTAEGTPNPVLEAAACGRPCITTDVGVVPEFVQGSGLVVDRTIEAFREAILRLAGDRKELAAMGAAARAAAAGYDWRIQVQQYEPILEFASVNTPLYREAAAIAPETDPVAPVTAVTITTGRDTYPACKRALAGQTTPFVHVEVRDVRPMDRAFQCMLDGARGPLFVQIDEDMVLYPDALQRMRQAIEQEPADVWAMAFPLLDTHLGVPIIGCKIYRTGLARRFPYRSTGSCEMDQLERAEAAGLTMKVMPLDTPPVGEHRLGNNPQVIADRYFRLGRKQRAFGYIWISEIPRLLARRPGDLRADTIAIMALAEGQAAGPAEAESDTTIPPKLTKLIATLYGGKR